jgi:hypothetical protein
MAAYSLNLKDVESALLHAQQRGVQVRLVMESDNMNTTEVKALKAPMFRLSAIILQD